MGSYYSRKTDTSKMSFCQVCKKLTECKKNTTAYFKVSNDLRFKFNECLKCGCNKRQLNFTSP